MLIENLYNHIRNVPRETMVNNYFVLTILYNFVRYRVNGLLMIKQITIATILTASTFACSIASGQGYDRSKLTKLDHKYTIGFERQIHTLYNDNNVGSVSNKTSMLEESTNRILFRMKLTTRLRLETGLSFRDINKILSNNGKQNKTISFTSPLINSIPLTIQYQLQNERKRLRPYIGTGVQFFNPNNQNNNNTRDENTTNNESRISNGLKYINIIFTQGLIYDITPDLQISQSIHITPDNGIRPIGINIGVGYRIK